MECQSKQQCMQMVVDALNSNSELVNWGARVSLHALCACGLTKATSHGNLNAQSAFHCCSMDSHPKHTATSCDVAAQ